MVMLAWRVWRRELLWLVFLAGLASVLLLAGIFEPLELMTHDARFLLRGYRLASSDVVIVGVTRQSLDRIGEPPWPRSTYATVIDRLSKAGARLICFDVFFAGPTTPPEDQRLIDATRAAGNVLFPVFCPVELRRLEKGPIRRVGTLRENFPALTQVAAGVGHINTPPAADGKCRAVPIGLEYAGGIYFGFGIEGALRFVEMRNGSVGPSRTGVLAARLPLTEDGNLLINYYGQHATFDFVPFHQVLDNSFPKASVKDKVVLVGQTALGQVNADLATTPFGEMYGVLVQGTIMDNILTGNCLKRQARASAVTVILAVALLTGVLFTRLPPLWAAVAWGLVLAGLCGAAMYVFAEGSYLLDVVPCAILITANFGFALAVNLQRSRSMAQAKEMELSSIFKSAQLSADPRVTQHAPEALVRLVGEAIGAEMVVLSLQQGSAAWHWHNPVARTHRRRLELETVQGIETLANGWLYGKKRAFLTTNPSRDGLPGVTADIPVRSFLSVPLMPRQEAIGLLNFYNKMPSQVSPTDDFTANDLRLVAVLAQQAALLLDNAVLIKELEVSNLQLRQAMDQLRNAQDTLIRKEKLSVVGTMASMIIHDMRGPLTVASWYADLMHEIGTGDARVRDYSDHIMHELQRISVMAQEVLDFSRGTRKTALQLTTVRSLVDALQERFHNEYQQAPVTLRADVSYWSSLLVDKERIVNVLMNLVHNAVDAMDGSGTVTVTCQQVPSGLELAVVDHGKGIPDEIRERLFEPFVTAGKAKGTGLGLAIVKKVVEDHGGSVRAESTPGQGARFTIFLPLPGAVDAESSRGAEAAAALPASASQAAGR